jgi:hypothetical protein
MKNLISDGRTFIKDGPYKMVFQSMAGKTSEELRFRVFHGLNPHPAEATFPIEARLRDDIRIGKTKTG